MRREHMIYISSTKRNKCYSQSDHSYSDIRFCKQDNVVSHAHNKAYCCTASIRDR